MQYKYALRENWQDYAAGRVFHHFPGQAVFPVRLASEIFQRAYKIWSARGTNKKACHLFDPCCGGAYQLTILGHLHRPAIAQISAFDIDARALELAAMNLRLLTEEGLRERRQQLQNLFDEYEKPSHAVAIKSANKFLKHMRHWEQGDIPYTLAQVNALDAQALGDNLPQPADILFCDAPYGRRSQWQAAEGIDDPLTAMLGALKTYLTAHSVVAIASNKVQKIRHPDYQRLERFKIGHRQIALLSLIE
jgi:23S rRNA (guanine2535-N1)-methyltransferase